MHPSQKNGSNPKPRFFSLIPPPTCPILVHFQILLILPINKLPFCSLKILSSFSPQGLGVYCSLCSECPPSILSIAGCPHPSDLNSRVISEGTSLAIFSKGTPLHPNYISLFISLIAPPQHKIILFAVHFLSSFSAL